MYKKQLDFFMRNERVEPMKINRIKVGGFKNINKFEIDFDSMIALVSQNSFGKSNILNALNFGIDFIKESQEFKRDMMSWVKGIPLNKNMVNQNFNIELEMSTTMDSIEHSVLYGYEFEWSRNDDNGTRIISEWLKIKTNKKNKKYNNFIVRNHEKSLYRTSETGRCSNKIKIQDNNLIVNKLLAYDNLYYFEIIEKINKLNMYIEKHLDANSSYIHDPFIRTDMEILQIHDYKVNIPRLIYHLKKKFPDKYEILINSFKLLFPSITDIEVKQLESKGGIKAEIPEDIPLRIDDLIYVMHVVDSNLNQPIRFDSISDGAKRVFLTLTIILLADINNYSIIAIEEPENSIHPSLLQKYLRVISQFIGNCNVIITSHSPYIIQYLNPHDIYIGIPQNNGIADFSRIRQSSQKSLINDALSLNMSTGDYIFDLLSGADDDIELLTQYLQGHKK